MANLKRELTFWDQLILGLAGTVGTGVLFATAGMAALAGPSVVLAWLLGGIMYAFITVTYIELAQTYPEAGGPARYLLYTHGPIGNMLNAMANFVWYLFIPAFEALGFVEGVDYFWPHFIGHSGAPTLLGGIAGVVVMFLFVPFNYFGVRAFARSTDWLGAFKLLLYVVAGFGFLGVAHFANLTRFGGLAPFGFNGIFAAVPLGMVGYGGIRVVADYSEEIHDTSGVRRSFVWIIVGQTLLYVLFGLGFVVSLNWSQLKLHLGSWTSISTIKGNPFVVIASAEHVTWLIPVILVIAIVGPFVTGYIYQGAGSRVAVALARSGYLSTKAQEISQKYAVPLWALIVIAVLGAVVAFISAPLHSIYGIMQDAVVGGYLALACNSVVMLALRRSGRKPRSAVWGGEAFAVLAFASVSLIVYWSGWPSVPFGVALIGLGSLVFALAYKVRAGFANAIWYMAYMVFLSVMSYIGSVGARDLVGLDLGSLTVALVSVLVFLPWGVASRVSIQEMDRLHSGPEESRVPAGLVRGAVQ